jgi:general L-amino acid transport system substrate-binding protein
MKKLAFIAAAGAVAVAGVAQADTLSDTIERGVVNCGVNTGVVGFGQQGDDGVWRGFDVDVCRAISAAIFGDADQVEYFPVTSAERFNKLNSGDYDVLARNTTWTFSRDVDLGLSFQGVNYYDGQGFMVPTSLGVSSATELDGATVCVQTGTTTELNLADFFADNGISYTAYAISTAAETNEAYLAGLCDVYTTDASGLAANRTTFPDPSAHVILPEIVSKEPLGPVTRQGDDVWGDIVRWTLNSLIIAEELGITAANAADMAADADASAGVKRLLGAEGGYGGMLGLSDDAFLNAISAVGNYGESFDRNVGPDTAVGLSRGLNALWTDGGILYAPPFR